jgi:hypothetical protein
MTPDSDSAYLLHSGDRVIMTPDSDSEDLDEYMTSSSSSFAQAEVVDDGEGDWDTFDTLRPKPFQQKKPMEVWTEERRFADLPAFELWKQSESGVDWRVGCKSNKKVNGEYTYKNYECTSHSGCYAKVIKTYILNSVHHRNLYYRKKSRGPTQGGSCTRTTKNTTTCPLRRKSAEFLPSIAVLCSTN